MIDISEGLHGCAAEPVFQTNYCGFCVVKEWFYLLVAVVYLHDITTYINIREISQMNHANKDLKEVKNL